MLILFIVGVLLGAAAMLVPLHRARRAAEEAHEERLHLAQERQLVVDFMHHMVLALGEGLDAAALRQRIVHAAILCSGALSAALFQRTGNGQMRSVAVEGLFPPHRPLPSGANDTLGTRARFIEQVLKSEEFPDHEGVVGAVVTTGQGQLIANAETDPRIVRHEDPALAVRSVIAVPVRFRESFFGVLAVANSADGGPFTQNDFILLQSLAEQAALALHNADLLSMQVEKRQMDVDLSLAIGIQQMLLPRDPPTIAGLDLDARYAAAQKVSGDFYDMIPLSPTRLGVVVADVSGKGIAAAMLMSICRTALRQIAPRHTSPAEALRELNHALQGDTHPGMFITLLYAVVDVSADQVTLARAGHEKPLLAQHNPQSHAVQTEFVASEGMPLGMVEDELFGMALRDVVRPFEQGDVLVLYTDGLTEAPNEHGTEYSGARLADTVRVLFRSSAREINDGVLHSLSRFSGDVAQRDDLTLVTVKRT